MKTLIAHHLSRPVKIAIPLLIILALISINVFFIRKTNMLNTEILRLNGEIERLSINLKSSEDTLHNTKIERDGLQENLLDAQETIADFERETKRNARTIKDLKKLTETDPELLKKYSKVYFLSENYAPARVTEIDEQFLFKKTEKESFLRDAYPFLEDMLEDAKDDGVTILVASAYRSFSEQKALKSNYKVVYGAGTANQFSADQGYSEHQMGTTVDLNSPDNPGLTVSFEKTDAFKWLTENAHKYGFVLSYPKGNSYYQYEPWHWRFVGKDLARDLKKQNKNFYDLDQREIDEYLVNIFD